MAAGVIKHFPPAAQASPDTEAREKGIRALRLELEAQTESGPRALLLHEIARIQERRDDLAAAARDELAATKSAAGFVEALESLIDIAARSRSKANLAKLLERSAKLADSSEERTRSALCLAAVHLSGEDAGAAQTVIETALEDEPTSSLLWLALERIAAHTEDPGLRLQAATGRAAHARSPRLRCLLLERVARLQVEHGDVESAFATLRQSIDELPSFRALGAWESLALQKGDYSQAALAASQTATIIRACLEEPDEAELYDVPTYELNNTRATATQVRALVYCIKGEDREEALNLCDQLLATVPESSLARTLYAALQRDKMEWESFAQQLAQLVEHQEWQEEDRSFLLTVASLAAIRGGSSELSTELSARLQRTAPETFDAKLRAWLDAEQTDTPTLSNTQTALEACLGPKKSPSGGSLAAAYLSAVQGNLDEADSLVEDLDARQQQADENDAAVLDESESLFLLGLKRAFAETRKNRGAELEALRALYPRLDSAQDRNSVEAEMLRLELLERIDESEPELLRGGSPWGELLLSTVAASKNDERAEKLLGALGRFEDKFIQKNLSREDEEGSTSALPRESLELLIDATTALKVLLGAPADVATATSKGTGALLLGTQLASTSTEELAAELEGLAARLGDAELGLSWVLRALFLHLRDGQTEEVLRILEDQSEDENFHALRRWTGFLKAQGKPKDSFALLKANGDDERRLEFLALVRRFAPDSLRDSFNAASAPTERLFEVLAAASQDRDWLEQALGSSEDLSAAAAAVLPLALASPQSEPRSILEDAERWHHASPTRLSTTVQLIAARKAKDRFIEEEARAELAESLSSDELLVQLDPAELTEERRNWRRARLTALSEAPREDDAKANRLQLAASWALVEEVADVQGNDAALAYQRLAQSLDEGLDDPDAQLALLSAAYQFLLNSEFEKAVELFERLFKVLGADLTLCHGLRLAAEKTGRYELEAQATCELARHASDNRASSELWERAGMLFQDHLSDDEEAETCFNAALARTPGSPIAFERVYRFARQRKDRQRQVDLIDARLDTAESETLRIELFWEKARFCRMLGKRNVSLRSLEELLELAPDHLPSLALAAELHLVDSRNDAAAEILSQIARHPDTPEDERRRAGLFACDLFEQLHRPRDAVELLQDLEQWSILTPAALERKARSHARSGDWGEAYSAFRTINDDQDDIEARLEAARMMLAIQRDHLRQPDELKDAARRVLRDSEKDADAILIVLATKFAPEERRRLLADVREESRKKLQQNPLNPGEISQFAEYCQDCGNEALERVSLGILELTGKLGEERSHTLRRLQERCPLTPCAPWSNTDVEALQAPELWGGLGDFSRLLSPYLAARLEPSLQTLGVTGLQRVDEFSDSPARHAVEAWMSAMGQNDFDFYIGGHEGSSIRGLSVGQPTLVIGQQVEAPLSSLHQALVASQLSALLTRSSVLLNQPRDQVEGWLHAAQLFTQPNAAPSGERDLDEKVQLLSGSVPRAEREGLTEMHDELMRAGVDIRQLPYAVMHSGARAAVLAYGDPSVLRLAPQLMPEDETQRNQMIAELIRFCLSDTFFSLRRRAGLESA